MAWPPGLCSLESRRWFRLALDPGGGTALGSLCPLVCPARWYAYVIGQPINPSLGQGSVGRGSSARRTLSRMEQRGWEEFPRDEIADGWEMLESKVR